MAINIELKRVDIAATPNLEDKIETLANNGANAGFDLVSTFTYQNQLVLIFQKTT